MDPAAGEANYTYHLPDGMGRAPAYELWRGHGWHVALSEPAPPTFRQLEANFGGQSEGAVLLRLGVTAAGEAQQATMHVLEAAVPALQGAALPAAARQRLQWAASIDPTVPRHHVLPV